jgi:hypothetical protein
MFGTGTVPAVPLPFESGYYDIVHVYVNDPGRLRLLTYAPLASCASGGRRPARCSTARSDGESCSGGTARVAKRALPVVVRAGVTRAAAAGARGGTAAAATAAAVLLGRPVPHGAAIEARAGTCSSSLPPVHRVALASAAEARPRACVRARLVAVVGIMAAAAGRFCPLPRRATVLVLASLLLGSNVK